MLIWRTLYVENKASKPKIWRIEMQIWRTDYIYKFLINNKIRKSTKDFQCKKQEIWRTANLLCCSFLTQIQRK